MTSYNILFAGFGGQGILFSGKVIAYAGLMEGKEISWLPSYGPEMRGGTANCSVCISDDPIGSPLVVNPDVLVAMNLPSLDGVALAQRVTVDSVKNVRAAKKAIKKAFEYQMEGLGYTIVEVLSTCPTNWGMSPQAAIKRLQDEMIPYYPLGVYKDIKEGKE